MNYYERTAQVNQRGRPFDFFFDQFLTKCEERTSQANKEEGLLICRSTSSQPSMKKGLRKIIKDRRPHEIVVDQFETKCEERTSQDNQRGRHHEIVVDQFETKCEEKTSQDNQRGRPLDIVVDRL